MRYFSWVQLDEHRYIVNPEPNHAAVTVFEPETRTMRTGLLDARGNPIMRTDPPEAAAFVRFKDG